MSKQEQEISAAARQLLIELAEGFAEGIRKNNIKFSEGNARSIGQWAEEVVHPDAHISKGSEWVNITEACDLIGMTQPTFRKYIRKGLIPNGKKRRGNHSPEWEKSVILEFKQVYFSQIRKGLKE